MARWIMPLGVLCTLLALFPGPHSFGSPRTITVAQDGSGDFADVQSAIDSLPSPNESPVVILIKPGRYKQHVVVPKGLNRLTFRGEDARLTILTDDKNVKVILPDGRPISTPDSASTLIRGEDFTAENITFENTSGNNGQGLAMYHDADRGIFRNCRFLGWQDTLRVNRGRSYFENCYIEGHVDFIYSRGTAWFEKCHIHCLADGYITAASTEPGDPFGYVFHECTVTAAPGVKRTFLGRPWRPHASVTFLRCHLPAQIAPEGWDNWRNPENEKTARFAEFESRGPGANPAARVPWSRQLNAEEAARITLATVLGGKDGWDPTMRSASTMTRTAKIRIALAGDSTVTDDQGWGAGFAALTETTVDVINLAKGGRSSKSYREEGHWQKVLDCRPDYVLIQFGHNDQPGKGPARQTDPQTTYRQNLRRYVEESRAIGAQPVLVTSMARRRFEPDGRIRCDLEDYASVVREVAAEMNVPLIDLHKRSRELFESLGDEGCHTLEFKKEDGTYDRTHLNARGSELVGRVVVEDLQRVVPQLAEHLK
ncbi:MAG: pectinesterase family protein [Phycisphaerae bacterium]|nr:pectinesterase family protein [Phycisphaerae bacterium]MDW8261281.1 pectinesterase family protein [Phycisphaerales bacterium]